MEPKSDQLHRNMSKALKIRRLRPDELDDVCRFVESVITEVYGHLISDQARPLADKDQWREGWLAMDGSDIIGAGRTSKDYIPDLWVDAAYRGKGIGGALLAALETEIAKRGHQQMRLRVVAENKRARQFYAINGWREVKTYRHERDGHLMVDFVKHL